MPLEHGQRWEVGPRAGAGIAQEEIAERRRKLLKGEGTLAFYWLWSEKVVHGGFKDTFNAVNAIDDLRGVLQYQSSRKVWILLF